MFEVVIILLSLFIKSFAFYQSSSNVIELNADNFDKLVKDSSEIWVIEFYTPWCGHCQNFAPEYQKSADALKGIAKVGAVNADKEKILAERFHIRGFPTVLLFEDNKNQEYKGQRRASDLLDVVLTALRSKAYAQLGGEFSSYRKSKDIIELTENNFNESVVNSKETWLILFHSPWCGHCKKLAPEWIKVAAELADKVRVGVLDGTVHSSKALYYGIDGYPTIKLFNPVLEKPLDYTGDRMSSDIVNWAIDRFVEYLPTPKIMQVIDEQSLKGACEKQTVCVVSVLPDILDCQSECRNNYLDILKNVSISYKKNLWGWIWFEARSQPNLEECLEINGTGYPAMAVVNIKKIKYSILRGSFSNDGIKEFLRDITYGRAPTIALNVQVLPEILTIEPWDEMDALIPTYEDEDDNDLKDEL